MSWKPNDYINSLFLNCCSNEHLADAYSTVSHNVSSTLSLFDRVGRIVSYKIDMENICIVGQKNYQFLWLSRLLIDYFQKSSKSLKVIESYDFCMLSRSERLNPSVKYLVYVDSSSMNFSELAEVDKFCKVKFIFKFPGLELSHSGEIININNFIGIISVFGVDFASSIRLTASLSEEEFLVISGRKQFIRSLTKENQRSYGGLIN
ncbi:MAG: hypothetical protein KA998_00135 [Rickettsiaceae bacterium]|nr:hypothetical protein [Rickettsiaceae bacterium]